jgi:hypothetical protein
MTGRGLPLEELLEELDEELEEELEDELDEPVGALPPPPLLPQAARPSANKHTANLFMY